MIEAVRDDWNNRATPTRGKRSQFMIHFPKPTNNDGLNDFVIFDDGNGSSDLPPELEVKFLAP